MANVFDQFDAPQGSNPFDQFDASPVASSPATPNPDVAVPWYTPITSAPGNAYNVAHGLFDAVRHPLDTANGLTSIANGAIANIPGVSAVNDWAEKNLAFPARDRTQEASDQATASAVGQNAYDSFSSPTRAWNTIATHPVDTLMTVAPGLGQLGKVADVAGLAKTASVLDKASEFTNPVNMVGKPISIASDYAFGQTPLQSAVDSIKDPQVALDAVKAEAAAKWKAIQDQNIQFPASTYKPFVQDLLSSTKNIGSEAAPTASSFRSKVAGLLGPEPDMGPQTVPHPMTGAPMTVYPTPGPDTRTVPFNDLNELFRNVKTAAVDPGLDNTEHALASRIAAKIGGYTDTVKGLQSDLADANELSRRKILAENLARMGNKAEWYVSGDESGLKNQVSALGKREGENFTPEERAAYQNIVRKEGLNSIISTAGGRLGQLVLHGIGAGIGTSTGVGPIAGMIGSGAAHLAARSISEARTVKAVNHALKTVLIGKKAQIASRTATRAKRLPFNDKDWIKALLAGRALTASTATQ